MLRSPVWDGLRARRANMVNPSRYFRAIPEGIVANANSACYQVKHYKNVHLQSAIHLGDFMFSSWMRRAAIAAFGMGILISAGSAQAAITINVSALTAVGPGGGMSVFIPAGEYEITWIGATGDGLYDAAYTNGCPSSNCWTEQVRVADGADFFPTNGTVNFYGTAGFSSAAAALAGIQSGVIVHHAVEFTNGVAGPNITLPSITQPWIVDIPDGTFNFSIPDPDGSILNNFGGVSLQLTAVPEPATWLMLLFGFGAVGWMLRAGRKGLAAR
jgi:hypothetical protein